MAPRAILEYCKEVSTYFAWLEAIQCDLSRVGSVMLCSYLRSSLSMGKSIPTKVRCALNWFEQHAKVPLNSLGLDVRDFTSSLTCAGGPAGSLFKAKAQAPLAGGAAELAAPPRGHGTDLTGFRACLARV